MDVVFFKSGHVLYKSRLKWSMHITGIFWLFLSCFHSLFYFIVLFYTINSKLLDSYCDLMTGFTVETYTNNKLGLLQVSDVNYRL